MTLTYRSVKGSALTADEFDGNTAEIAAVKDRVTTLEGETLVSITSITQAGGVMTIHLSNSTAVNLVMPVLDINDRGEWAPDTFYAKDDYFTTNGGFFRVLLDHTSGDTFDEFANDGLGHDYYRRLMSSPANSFPDGGELGDVIMKLSATEQDKGWRKLPSIYVNFDPSSDSDIPEGSVAEALEWLETRIASAIAAAVAELDAAGIAFDPSSASGLISTTVADALDELATRAVAFADLSGHISAEQSRDPTVTALSPTSGTVVIEPDLGDVFTLTPTGHITLNCDGPGPANARITLIITTSGTTSYNVTPSSNCKGQGALATGTVDGKTFAITFVGDGTNLVEVSRTAAM